MFNSCLTEKTSYFCSENISTNGIHENRHSPSEDQLHSKGCIKFFNNNNNNNNNNNVTVLWNQAVHTDREVAANRPDIIIKNKKEKTCTLIDVAIPADRNVVQKEAEKKLKYKSLCIEIQRMWNLKCTIIPIIIGATGIVTRSLRENLEAVPGKHSIDSLQKTAILGTSHIIRKVLQCEA